MSRTGLWVFSAVLILLGIGILFVYLPGRQSKLAREGRKADGTVQMKDSHPTPDGKTVNFVTVLYLDEQNKNHQNTVEVYDEGVFNDLEARRPVTVYYLPSDPDHGSIRGGEGMTTPRAGAFKFVAWTALLAGFALAVKAWLTPQKPAGPVMARR